MGDEKTCNQKRSRRREKRTKKEARQQPVLDVDTLACLSSQKVAQDPKGGKWRVLKGREKP